MMKKVIAENSQGKEKLFQLLRKIPSGKVLTYKKAAELTSLKSPRVVGNYLHKNTNPQKFPCHRVVHTDGSLASGFAFGGLVKQKEKLVNEKVTFRNNKVDLGKSLWNGLYL